MFLIANFSRVSYNHLTKIFALAHSKRQLHFPEKLCGVQLIHQDSSLSTNEQAYCSDSKP